MAEHPTRENDGVSALLVRIMGVVMAIVFAMAIAGVMPVTHGRPDAKTAAATARSEIDEARGRAIAWSTPECRDRVRKAVAKASTGRKVEDAAWAACPDHPDAFD